MNSTDIDAILKKHPVTGHVLKGVYARNRLPRDINVPFTLVGNTDLPGTHWVAVYVDANSRGKYYDPTG